MSRQSEARDAQGYVSVANTCSTCLNRTSEMKLPEWMQERNDQRAKRGLEPEFGKRHMVEMHQRCGIGGFAIKLRGCCALYRQE